MRSVQQYKKDSAGRVGLQKNKICNKGRKSDLKTGSLFWKVDMEHVLVTLYYQSELKSTWLVNYLQ